MLVRARIGGIAAAAASLFVGVPDPAGAHHGWSGYDASQLVTLTGTVQSATFDFPHAMLMLQADGKVWEIVLAPPSRMERRGLPAGSIVAGQEVMVEGYAHRTDEAEFRAERIQVNGSAVELR
jgi:Family of unknown function (DUF6152)